MKVADRLRFFFRSVFGTYPTTRIGDLAFLDLRADRFLDGDQLEQTLREALAFISEAKGGFGELVTSHLKNVVANDYNENVSPFAQSYYTTFPATDRRSPFLLACNLVWAATLIRLLRNRPIWNRRTYVDQARLHAKEARMRFVRQFPDHEEWDRFFNGS